MMARLGCVFRWRAGGGALRFVPLAFALACGGHRTSENDDFYDEYPSSGDDSTSGGHATGEDSTGDGDSSGDPDSTREGGADGDGDSTENASAVNETSGGAPAPQTLRIGPNAVPLLVGGETTSQFAMASTDETGRDSTYSVSVGSDSPRATLGIHRPHVDIGAHFRSVEFSARASRPLSLIVTISPSEGSYFQALEEGRPWQGVAVPLSDEWQDYSVLIEEMMPLGEGEPAPLGLAQASALTLIVEEPEITKVWVADLALVP